ncbi:MAG TPA: anthranilate phosphoribosyltransferase [Acidimicrobiales bacterium]|nr:anthranilate phosphoribosyltransferase [Acidimicrobiales bacterium]
MTTLADLGGWSPVLRRLLSGKDLTAEETDAAFGDVLEGTATPAQIAAFVVALRMKGETVPEMAGMVRALFRFAVPLEVPDAADVVDTCGTGGDGSGSINVSTVAAFVVAGAGARVVKHGNRAMSSATGSADLLEALGVVADLGPAGVVRCLDEAGMAFCFAQRFHPCFRFAAPVRRELGVPTVFNFLGPLANPAHPGRQVVGVSDPAMAEKMAGVLAANGARRALVVYGHDGLDELTTTTTSTVIDARNGELVRSTVDPAALGLRSAGPDDLAGGDPASNATAARRILDGEHGHHRDLVVLNAAAGVLVAGLAPSLEAAVEVAARSIDEGRAAGVLERLVAASTTAAASA